MTPATRYKKFSVKPLVAIIYLLVFSVQFNSRYFSIASYFDYAGCSKVKAVLASPMLAAERATHPVVYNRNIPNKAHLAIDKRYQGKRIMATVPEPIRPEPFYYPQLCVKFYSIDPAIVSADPVITSLRGPPCA